jgi:hypothetical protein
VDGEYLVQRLNDQLNAPWEETSLDLHRLINFGENVLSSASLMRGGRDGIEVTLPFAHLSTLRNGQVVRRDWCSPPSSSRFLRGPRAGFWSAPTLHRTRRTCYKSG